ncbi:MAG: hypothetical protein E7214_05940 [Clostridium sp.]|nr:hypothetical protein [Clostridium sp.]
MRKFFKGIVFTLVMSCLMITNAFASVNADQVASDMRSLGIAESYIANMIEYLQCITITSSQESQLQGYVRQAEGVAGGQSNLNLLSAEKKLQLKTIAQNAAAVVGLNVSFGKNSNGLSTLVLSKSNGSILLVLTTENANNVNLNLISQIISDAVSFSASTNKSTSTTPAKSGSTAKKYRAVSGGAYSKTATNTENLLFAGASLICVSGVILVLRKRKACMN